MVIKSIFTLLENNLLVIEKIVTFSICNLRRTWRKRLHRTFISHYGATEPRVDRHATLRQRTTWTCGPGNLIQPDTFFLHYNFFSLLLLTVLHVMIFQEIFSFTFLSFS